MEPLTVSRSVGGTTQSRILITGSTGGLGKAFAVECASRGWDLFLTDVREDALNTLSASLQATYGVSVVHHACDLTDAPSRQALFKNIQANGVHFWGLINVAGIDYEGLFLNLSQPQISTILRLNVEVTLAMIHALFAYRDPCLPFRIINVASLAAFYPMPFKATYAATKRFLLDFSLALREEVRDRGATITVLCPAGMPTTPETVKAIEAQGFFGFATTQNIGSVAAGTLDAALNGQAVFIPGVLNRVLYILGALVPTPLIVHLIGSRWKKVHSQRDLESSPLFPRRSPQPDALVIGRGSQSTP
jgi:uncharacterized protein